MSKIIQAVNAMISNEKEISGVKRRNDEYLFLYKGKYKWSIIHKEDQESDEYILFFYPGKETIEHLISISDLDWQFFKEYIAYNSRDLGTKEAYSTFKEIYMIVKEKIFGVDKVLDEIIEDF